MYDITRIGDISRDNIIWGKPSKLCPKARDTSHFQNYILLSLSFSRESKNSNVKCVCFFFFNCIQIELVLEIIVQACNDITRIGNISRDNINLVNCARNQEDTSHFQNYILLSLSFSRESKNSNVKRASSCLIAFKLN